MKSNLVFALVDCNNFFVSCERVFAPNLQNKAVVVLSSNDGCAIARSNEAKALGIKMGAPFFQFSDLYEQGKLAVLSSNFALYSNMSTRIMQSLKMLCPAVEVYSIDEAFLGLEQLYITNYIEFGAEIKQKLLQWSGIPVSVGIAPTKTLAKIAGLFAKKLGGVYSLIDHPDLDHLLSNFPIEDVWGIGKNLAPRLRMLGIGNAKALRDSDLGFIRKNFSVVVERVACELRGISCIESTSLPSGKKSITYSRTFGAPVTCLEELEEAISDYVSNACIKLRKQHSRAGAICIALSAGFHNKSEPEDKNNLIHRLPCPSNDTREIIRYSKLCLLQLYKAGCKYNKISITLTDLQPTDKEQIQLFHKSDYKKSDKLMQALDQINQNMGKNSVFMAAQGTERAWATQSLRRSQEYTSNWNELPLVK